MTLQDLTGEHILDAVDFSDEQVETWGERFEPCQVIRFRLDGSVYMVVEDPSDGYRSSMRDIEVCADEMTNVFEGVKVIGSYRSNSSYGGSADILQLIDAQTGEVVLEAGTDNSDDYYPSFVANFTPEAMCINKPRVQGEMNAD